MYAVSEAYRTALAAPGRTERVQGSIALADGSVLPLDDSVLKAGSLTVDNQCVNGEELEFGAVYAGQLKMTVLLDCDRYALYDGVVTLQWALRLADGSWESLPMGVYTVTEAVRQGRYLQLTALDCLVKFEQAFDGVSTLGTPFALLRYLCEKVGVGLANTEAEILAMPNGGGQYQLDADGMTTWRDGVALVAQLLAGFATATREGELRIQPFGRVAVAEVAADARFATEVADYRTAYRGVRVTTDRGMLESYDPAENGLVMEIAGNVLFHYGLDEARQGMVDAVRAALCALDYTPATLSMAGDPALECGDRVVLRAVDDGNGQTGDVETLLTGYQWAYRGRERLESVGKNPRLASLKSRSERDTAALRGQLNTDRLVLKPFASPAALYLRAGMQVEVMAVAVTTVKETGAVLLGQLLLETAGEGAQQLEMAYAINGAVVTDFAPARSLTAGSHCLPLFYMLPTLAANTTTRIVLRLRLTGGAGSLPAGGLRAVVLGQGLASGAAAWDGTLTFTEQSGLWAAEAAAVALPGVAAGAVAALGAPDATALSAMCGLWSVEPAGQVLLGALRATVAQSGKQQRWVMSDTQNTPAYDADWVERAGPGYRLRGSWAYESVNEAIDSGGLAVCRLKTVGLASVAAVEVTEWQVRLPGVC
ncbi:MAG: hypothetical protein PHO10_03095 [Gemmiger sp.]|nr:hypothetical protein [Gemmiger sp.]